MDDIQDILASVSRPTLPERSLDLQAMTRAWVNERTAPTLLPYPSALVGRMTDRIKKQIERIEEMTGMMDPQANFTLVVLQTELERFKFLVRSFLRARLAKIDEYPVHYRIISRSDPTMLSSIEQQYLRSHQALLTSHYHASFLSAFPRSLQRLDDDTGSVTMIDTPDLDRAVFCRVLRDVGRIEIQGATEASEIELRRGDLWVLRFSAVHEAVLRGDAELA